MSTQTKNVLPLFRPPDREFSLHVIGLCLAKVRGRGITLAQLSAELDCSIDTIKNATNEDALLSFDSIARLGYHYPEEFQVVEQLWNCQPSRELTAVEHMDEAVRHIDAARKDVA